MSWKHFTPLPQNATLSFGGYSFVHPEAWDRYLDKVIQEEYPDYFSEHLQGQMKNARWRDQESCILSSLENYLFHEFGIFIPEENLFKVFNKDGKGLELFNMLEAISAVIEPLGLEIDLTLALDAEIIAALGESDRVIDEKQARLVEGRPGLCMINVENGYNHAFFWPKIDSRCTRHKKFRLIVLIKKSAEEGIPQRSALVGLDAFLKYFWEAIRLDLKDHRLNVECPGEILAEIGELERYCTNTDQEWDVDTRAQIDQRLAILIEIYQDFTDQRSHLDRRTDGPSRTLLAAGQMIRRVIQESPRAR
jgi:hypothetical protein